MIEELQKTLTLHSFAGEPGFTSDQSVKANAARSTFLNLILKPQEGNTNKPLVQKELAVGSVFVELGRGNPPAFATKPLRPIAEFTWDQGANHFETTIPASQQFALSRSFDAFSVIFEVKFVQAEGLELPELRIPILVEAEWGRPEDEGGSQNIGTF
jgi:hypothetical protein